MNIGTIKYGSEIGQRANVKHIYLACKSCGKTRWVIIRKSFPLPEYCHPCYLKHHSPARKYPQQYCSDCGKKIRRSMSGYCKNCRYKHPEHNPGWKGGKTRDSSGHIMIKISKRGNGHNGYIAEHRLIWEQHYGPIPVGFVIHHLNGIPDDNRIENLSALPLKQHNAILKAYQLRIKQLENSIIELRTQLKPNFNHHHL